MILFPLSSGEKFIVKWATIIGGCCCAATLVALVVASFMLGA